MVLVVCILDYTIIQLFDFSPLLVKISSIAYIYIVIFTYENKHIGLHILKKSKFTYLHFKIDKFACHVHNAQ